MRSRQVLPFSTGVIMEPLPVEAHRRGSSGLRRRPARGQLGAGAEAIMTTDTVPRPGLGERISAPVT